jgi:hypothetical protein
MTSKQPARLLLYIARAHVSREHWGEAKVELGPKCSPGWRLVLSLRILACVCARVC